MFQSLFTVPFRPFFILCALVAVINPSIWMLNYAGFTDFETVFSSGSTWHGYEMVFGFACALICGFLLTSSSHWTGNKPKNGPKLVLLVFLFLLERLTPFFHFKPQASIVLMSLFHLLFLIYLFNMLRQNRNQLIMTPIVLLLFVAKLLFLIGDLYFIDWALDLGRHLGVMSIMLIISVFSGRVVPMFSAGQLGYKPVVPKVINFGSTYSLIPLLIPSEYLWSPLSILLMTIALVFNLLRFIYWQPRKCFKIPMISVFHMGQLFLTISIFIMLIEKVAMDLSIALAPLHGYTVGTLGIFGIGMLLRVSKGHTGQKITAEPLDKVIIHGIYFTALLRVLPVITGADFLIPILIFSTVTWCIAFWLYLYKYTFCLIMPRVDG